jgi:hypothetical protein
MYKKICLENTRVTDLRTLFKDRQISNKNFNNLLRGRFDIYYPSKDIIDKFRETSRALGESNPFIEARTDINSIKRDFRNLGLDTRFRTQRAVGGHIQEAMNDQYDVSAIIDKIAMDISSLKLSDEFNVKLSDYIQPATTVNAPPLPIQPMPNAQVLQPQAPLALLSPEEQQIRLRQRGLA